MIFQKNGTDPPPSYNRIASHQFSTQNNEKYFLTSQNSPHIVRPWKSNVLSKEPLDRSEPRPCKEIMATLLAKSWPAEQETLLAELDRLVKHYRLREALDLLNKDATG